MHKRTLLLTCGTAMLATAATIYATQSNSFSLKDPKGVNAITFVCDSPFEPIMGSANGIDGTINFDPAKPEASTGKLVLEASSIKTTHANMAEHMMGDEWLAPKENPNVTFEITKINEATKTGDNTFLLKATGKFTLKGVSEDKDIEIKVTYSPGRLGERNRGAEGDLLGFRTQFTFDRTKFKVGPDYPVIGKEVQVQVALAAFRPKGGESFISD